MRLVIQRVSGSRVSVDGKSVGAIEHGLNILVGITHDDSVENAQWLAQKVAGLRLFEDEGGKMNRSVLDVGGGALVISQFTLYGDARKGRRPSFTDAAAPDIAEALFDRFVQLLRETGIDPVETGVFGAMMQVEIHNDGPVTLLLER